MMKVMKLETTQGVKMSVLTKDHRLIEDTRLISPPTERQLLEEEVTGTRLPFRLRKKAGLVISEINTGENCTQRSLTVCLFLSHVNNSTIATHTHTHSDSILSWPLHYCLGLILFCNRRTDEWIATLYSTDITSTSSLNVTILNRSVLAIKSPCDP